MRAKKPAKAWAICPYNGSEPHLFTVDKVKRSAIKKYSDARRKSWNVCVDEDRVACVRVIITIVEG